jgi:hypothetical protein
MFIKPIATIIAEYATEYVLSDWIDEKKLDWAGLSLNPNAIDLLSSNTDKINWCVLSSNPMAMNLLLENPSKIRRL